MKYIYIYQHVMYIYIEHHLQKKQQSLMHPFLNRPNQKLFHQNKGSIIQPSNQATIKAHEPTRIYLLKRGEGWGLVGRSVRNRATKTWSEPRKKKKQPNYLLLNRDLVGGFFPPIWKICPSNWIISLRIGVNIKNLRNHHLGMLMSWCMK